MNTTSIYRSIKALVAVLALSAASVTSAGTIVFSVSTGEFGPNVGVITLTDRADVNTVNVFVDLLPGYGWVNTGSDNNDNKSIFAFNLSGTETGVKISNFITPDNLTTENIANVGDLGTYTASRVFSLDLSGGQNPSFGTFLIDLEYTGQNGGAGKYLGDLNFDLYRSSGLRVGDFDKNGLGYYFSGDLINSETGRTGQQGWKREETPNVPDSGTTAILLGAGLIALGLFRRKNG